MAKYLVKSLEDQFECSVCMESFVDPRVLICLHTFCERCLEKVVKKEGEKHIIKCPNCRKDTEVPEGRVENLQFNFFVNNLMAEVALHKDTQSADSTIACDDCTSGDPALVRCVTCCIFLCDICSQGHNRRKSTCSHQLITLEELKSSGPAAFSRRAVCELHEGELMKLYCESCELPICRDCTMVEHREHKYQFVRDVYTKEKAAVNQLLEKTKAKQTVLRDAVKGVVEMKSCVQKTGVKMAQQINSSVDSLIEALETGRNNLLQQAEQIERGKLKGLQIQQEELELALSSVTSSVEFTEKALRDGSQVEVLSMKKQMTDRLRELNTGTQPLKPCTDNVISYDVKPISPDEIVNRLGRVYDSRIDAEKCAVKIDSKMNALKLRKEIKMTILVNDQYGRPRSEAKADDVSVEIKSPGVEDGSQRVEVTSNGDGSYQVYYTPRVPGAHQVCIRINGADIRGSPFEWNVKGDVNPRKTALRMEAGEVGMVYNTFINQTRDFSIVTKNYKGDQICEEGSLISVEIQEPKNLNRKVVPVQDCGNGRYSFSYKPSCTGNNQLTVKVNGDDIQGSPFTWGVEQWHLLGWDRRSSNLRFSQDKMTVECLDLGLGEGVVGSCGFTAGCHSWIVKAVSGKLCSVGVIDCDVVPAQQVNMWFWCIGSKRHTCNGEPTDDQPSNIPCINEGDVVIVYLNHHNKTLTVYHLSSGQTDTWNDVTVQNNNLSPFFGLYSSSKISLLL